ncbi:M48 family metalloprotease [Derxia gummosa]|uniref:M48 family metalloprotease n=1 Tax=Derxia gummosa DSM 723 TaxID=1121388 RepID=A0A8B6X1E1_9BURK|nr:M48 family metalloprotease [Derxia gummosa]
MPSTSLRATAGRRAIAALLVTALGLGPAGVGGLAAGTVRAQVNLPDLGDADTEALPPSQERKLGERVMAQGWAAHDIYDDYEITEYISALGLRLARASDDLGNAGALLNLRPEDFRFFAVQDASINAFAMPGGFIGINTGLLTAAQSESELASVFGHEIGHVTQRHIARQMGGQRGANVAMIASLLVAVLAAASRSNSSGDLATAAMMAGQGSAIASQLAFSRDAEREADRVGFQTLTAAGFDPNGMVEFFGRLQRASRLYDAGNYAFLRTHPLTLERITDIEGRVRSVPPLAAPYLDSPEFWLARARARLAEDTTIAGNRAAMDFFKAEAERLTAPDAVAATGTHWMAARPAVAPGAGAGGSAPAASASNAPASGAATAAGAAMRPGTPASDGEVAARVGQFSATLPLLPASPAARAAPWYGLALARLAANDADGAAAALAEARKRLPVHAWFDRLEARILLARGKPDAAIAFADTARRRWPQSEPLRDDYGQLLLDAGRPRAAADYLREQTALLRSDARLHEQLARAWSQLGDSARQYQSMGEYYAQRGILTGAVQQLELAQKATRGGGASNADLALASEIDARLRGLRDQLREEMGEKNRQRGG